MVTIASPSITVLVAFATLLQTPPASDPSGQAPPADRGGTTDDPSAREQRRRQRRERWEQFRQASPEQRRRMRMERMVERAARIYDLDDAQRELVRQQIELTQSERREAMGAEAEEYDRLGERIFELWRTAADAGGSDAERRERWRQLRQDPEFTQARDRLRDLDRRYPFDWEAALSRVEALLPAEQAAKGRRRMDERRARWQARRNRRDGPDASALRSGDPAAVKPSPQSATDRPTVPETPIRQDAPPPMHPWERFVHEFIVRYELTPAQSASAVSILKDVRTRAARIEARHADRLREARKIADPAARSQQLKELNRSLDDLFAELKRRLDSLLTAAQRSKPAPG